MENSGLEFLGFVSLYPWKNSVWFPSASTSACAGKGPGCFISAWVVSRKCLTGHGRKERFFPSLETFQWLHVRGNGV